MQFRSFASAFVVVTACTMAFAHSSPAQQGALREGARVKIATPSQKDVVGVVEVVSPDTLVLFTEPHGARLGIGTATIQKLQVSRGRVASEGAKKGALWGAAVGAVTTLFIVGISEEEIVRDPDEEISKGEFAVQNFIGSVILGAGIGALIKAEKWDTVPFRAGVSASTGAISLRLSSAFR